MTAFTSEYNPFMLLINPEIILAAIDKSERLSQLNRHLCRPLDRLIPTPGNGVDDRPDGEASVDSDTN